MVLEHLFPEDWLEKKLRYAFILAFVYSTVSIIVARLLFAGNSGLVAVVFTSILLLPYLQRLFLKEEVAELHEKGGFNILRFFKDNLPGIKVYGVLFLGIYFAFMLYSFLLPAFGADTSIIFREQLALDSVRGAADFSIATFEAIFFNNWWVLLACFLLALLTGDGAIFFISWNASAWGAIFASRALDAAGAGFGDPIVNLLVIVIITLPHLLIEAGAYILAAIAGSIISDDVVSESGEIPHFLMYFLVAILAFITVVIVSSAIPGSAIRGMIYIITVSVLLWFLSFSFDNDDHRRVFSYNTRLFMVAILVFVLGVAVETFVLHSSDMLHSVYMAAR